MMIRFEQEQQLTKTLNGRQISSSTTHPTKKMSSMKNFGLVSSVSCFLLSTVLGFTTSNIECPSLLLTTQQLS